MLKIPESVVHECYSYYYNDKAVVLGVGAYVYLMDKSNYIGSFFSNLTTGLNL